MRFSDIPGHERVKERLREMADTDRLPHALLLEGPSGVGKFALARAYVQYIHCTDRGADGEPCGKCDSCVQHQKFNHIDTIWIFPVVKLDKMNTPPVSDDFAAEWQEYLSGRVFMDFGEWSSVFDSKKNVKPVNYVTESVSLLHKLSYTAHASKYKIVVWWLPELMNEETANKLLKVIEEPFGDTLFVMVSDNPAMILPTIYSRVQRLEVTRYSDSEVADWLMTTHGVDSANAAAIAHVARGNMTRVEAALGRSKRGAELLERFTQLMRLAWQRKVAELGEWSAKLSELSRDRQREFYEYAAGLLRENFMLNFNMPDLTFLNREELEFSSRFSKFITVDNVESLVEDFEQARSDLGFNANAKIVNFDTAMRVILHLLPKS